MLSQLLKSTNQEMVGKQHRFENMKPCLWVRKTNKRNLWCLDENTYTIWVPLSFCNGLCSGSQSNSPVFIRKVCAVSLHHKPIMQVVNTQADAEQLALPGGEAWVHELLEYGTVLLVLLFILLTQVCPGILSSVFPKCRVGALSLNCSQASLMVLPSSKTIKPSSSKRRNRHCNHYCVPLVGEIPFMHIIKGIEKCV